MKKFFRLTVLLLSLTCLWGCGAEVFLIGAGIGAGVGAGTYKYLEGSMTRDYPLAYTKAWETTNTALANLSITVSNSSNEGVKGNITAVRKDGTKVAIYITDRGQGVSTISVRVGNFGDKQDAQRIHEEIATVAGIK
ncbi:MAG: DUF3568 family protein [Nitrospirae bacterium]|nr:DUF3568 family protein [Nitrospirota bacterium]